VNSDPAMRYRRPMTEDIARDPDRRTQRTRKAIFDALIRLIFAQRYSTIRTADLIEAAGIGRSTFYEHFRSKDDVLVAVIDPIFLPLAIAATGRGSRPALRATLEHVWEQRAFARALFEPPLLARLQRKLAGMIEARLPAVDGPPPGLIAMGAAAGQLAMLRMWLAGEVSCSADVLAQEFLKPARLVTDEC
jgi:AcrR family transcriptional regulator